MPKKIKNLKPPTGLSRLLFRLPIFFFRIGLGWIFGKRFLLLNHIGRKSGLPRQVVVEIPWYDEATNTYYINAGFGPKSNWYQNILKTPDTTIQVGNKKFNIHAEQVSSDEGAELLLKFAKANPLEAKFVNALGYEVDGTDEDWQALGRELIFIALRPRE